MSTANPERSSLRADLPLYWNWRHYLVWFALLWPGLTAPLWVSASLALALVAASPLPRIVWACARKAELPEAEARVSRQVFLALAAFGLLPCAAFILAPRALLLVPGLGGDLYASVRPAAAFYEYLRERSAPHALAAANVAAFLYFLAVIAAFLSSAIFPIAYLRHTKQIKQGLWFIGIACYALCPISLTIAWIGVSNRRRFLVDISQNPAALLFWLVLFTVMAFFAFGAVLGQVQIYQRKSSRHILVGKANNAGDADEG